MLNIEFLRLRPSLSIALSALVLMSCEPSGPQSDDWMLACHLVTFDVAEDLLSQCAGLDDDQIVIRPEVLAAIEPGEPVEHLMVANQWFLARTGRAVPALTYDNGPDYFQEGLARIIVRGQVGFVDDELNVVIEPEWDFAFPFENGAAVVCTGCVEEPMGEHRTLQGGVWGYIDSEGNILVEPTHTRDSLPAADSIKPD